MNTKLEKSKVWNCVYCGAKCKTSDEYQEHECTGTFGEKVMPEVTDGELNLAIVAEPIKKDWIKKDDALEYVLENYYDEIREAVFEQEAEIKRE